MKARSHQRVALWFVGAVVSCMALAPGAVLAMPARQHARTLEQPDGTTFEARQWGDERSHGWETLDGHEIGRDPGSRAWKFILRESDDLPRLSDLTVGRDVPPGRARQPRRPAAFKRVSNTDTTALPTAPARISPAAAAASPRGTRPIPVVMADHTDTSPTTTAPQFESLLFGAGTDSMKDYYEEVSHGLFSVSSGPGGVSGWHQASSTRAYYGGNDAWGYDKKPGTLVYEAAQKADATGFNFAPYDSDGDCAVDVLAVIHQGTGEEYSGVDDDIWSHSWNLSSAQYYGYNDYGIYTTNDTCAANPSVKVTVNNYIIMPERQGTGLATIGVFAHEYGHALGLPDLYDTDESSSGLGDWSVMAAGGWNYISRDGDCPAHLDPWSKYYLGWLPLRQIEGTWTSEGITAADTAYDVYQLGSGTPLSGEYFLVENRRWNSFDFGLPSQGMLVWHVDGAWINNHYANNTVNDSECYSGGPSCSSQHYGVALVQADSLQELEVGTDNGDGGDPFPGSTNKRSLNDGTSPSLRYYSGTASNLGISAISNAAATMTATLTDGTSAPSLGAATDQPSWTWTTGGNASWFGTARTTGDGIDAVQSGWINDGQSTYLQASVNLTSSGTGP